MLFAAVDLAARSVRLALASFAPLAGIVSVEPFLVRFGVLTTLQNKNEEGMASKMAYNTIPWVCYRRRNMWLRLALASLCHPLIWLPCTCWFGRGYSFLVLVVMLVDK